jgi:hypothetical protein
MTAAGETPLVVLVEGLVLQLDLLCDLHRLLLPATRAEERHEGE